MLVKKGKINQTLISVVVVAAISAAPFSMHTGHSYSPRSMRPKANILQNLRTTNRLGGGFKYSLFSPLFGDMIQIDLFFSDGLKPPTSGSDETNGRFPLVSFYLGLFTGEAFCRQSETTRWKNPCRCSRSLLFWIAKCNSGLVLVLGFIEGESLGMECSLNVVHDCCI